MKKRFTIRIVVFLVGLFFSLFLSSGEARTQALEYDLGISAADIFFSTPTLISGQPIRLYAAVRNHGTKDVFGYAQFFAGSNLIGESQVVSVRAGGYSDEVFVDWVVPGGSFNIRVDIKGQIPRDENPSNDSAMTTLFYPKKDSDSDGIIDENDNCLDIYNPDQADVDGDGSGDLCDFDDDNDGLSDSNEGERGTSPVDPDTDDDGVLDGQDNCPLIVNPGQEDEDSDGVGNACDSKNDNLPSPSSPPSSPAPDQDGDGIPDSRDNCQTIKNSSQIDTDQDRQGDACDTDDDNDGISDSDENNEGTNPQKADTDEDGLNDDQELNLGTDPKNSDTDGDGISDGEDSQPLEQEGEGEDLIEGTDQVTAETETSKKFKNLFLKSVQVDWNTFTFEVKDGSSIGSLNYLWDMGDGTSLSGNPIQHVYEKSGTYLITAEVQDQAGDSRKLATTVRVKFWNPKNPYFSVPIGVLFGVTILWSTRRWLKRRNRLSDI